MRIVKVFRSRMSRPGRIRSLPLDLNVGITVGEASPGAFAAAIERLRAGGEVFVDNGAFGLWKAGTPMGVARAQAAIDIFERLAAVAPDRDRLTVVAPDVIGDGAATRALQRDLEPRLRALAERARLVIPLQGFDLEAAARTWRDALRSIGPRIVAGIPSVQRSPARWPGELVRAFVARTGARRVHFLGGTTRERAALELELGLEASSDSGYAVMRATRAGGFHVAGEREARAGERRVREVREAQRGLAFGETA